MSYDVGSPYMMTEREELMVFETMQLFSQLTLYRNTFASQWEEAAELILPTSRNTFFYGNYNWPGSKKTDRQVDANGMMALHRFAAICDSLTTPRNQKWHGLTAEDDVKYVLKQRDVKLWFEQVTNILFQHRYASGANFASQNNACFQSLGAFGNMAMFVDDLDQPGGGLRYKAMPLGEVYHMENHQGIVDGFCRYFRLTARQAWQKWGKTNGDRFPPTLKAALDQHNEWPFAFIHRVSPRDDYRVGALGPRGKQFHSIYISLEGRCLMAPEGGYYEFPAAIARYEQAPNEQYGRGPAQMVLPALKTLNAEKRTFLKAGHRAADPVLLTADDGLVPISLRPGAVNPGAVSSDGRPLVVPLQPGNIQISKEMMQEEKTLIQDAFLVTLFQILTETPQMTATEVIERTNEKGILLAPSVGRLQSEYVGPLVHRELGLLARQKKLPPMPLALRQAGGGYEVAHTSPLARAARAQEAAGFMRTVETAKEIANITQDSSILDPFDFDTALKEIADIQAVPESWMASPQAIAKKRQTRAAAQQRQEQIQAMPAMAAMAKAQQGGQPGAQEQPVAPGAPLTGGGPSQ